MACFSFYPTKNMTTSEGGMITTNNEEFLENAKVFRAHGSATKYHHDVLGYNFRMTDIAAAIGLEQLKKIDSFNDKRIENAKYLNEGLKDIDSIETPVVKDGCKHVYHQYTIKIKDGKRDELSDYLIENGIGNGIYYPIPLYNQVLYKELGYDQSLPVTEEIVEEVLSLPIHAKLVEEDLDYIVKTIKEFFKWFSLISLFLFYFNFFYLILIFHHSHSIFNRFYLFFQCSVFLISSIVYF